MAACQATLPLTSASRIPTQTPEVTLIGNSRACSARLRPQSIRNLFRIKEAPACKKTISCFAARARLGGDGDVDLNGDPVAEDFYSVLGLVYALKNQRTQDLFSFEFLAPPVENLSLKMRWRRWDRFIIVLFFLSADTGCNARGD